MDSVKPSNEILAIKVMNYASKLFFEERGQGLSITEQANIHYAAYCAFNSAIAAQARKRAT